MKKVLELLLVVMLLFSALAEDGYVPSHGITGVAFGCSPDEYLAATRGLNVPMKVSDNIAGRRTINAQSSFLYHGLPAMISANFQDDQLSYILLSFGGDESYSIDTTVFHGMLKLKTLYPELYKLYGEPIAVLEGFPFQDENGELIQYRYPLVNGEPDYETMEKYLATQTSGDLVRFCFAWDNMSLSVSVHGYAKSKSSSKTYNCFVDCYLDDEPAIPDTSVLVPYVEPSQNMFY